MKRFWLSGLGIGILLGLFECLTVGATGFRPTILVGLLNLLGLLVAAGLASFLAGRHTGRAWAGAGQAALAIAVSSLINQSFAWMFGPSPVQMAMRLTRNQPAATARVSMAFWQYLSSHPLERYLLLLVGVLGGAIIGGILGLLGGYVGKRLGASEKATGI